MQSLSKWFRNFFNVERDQQNSTIVLETVLENMPAMVFIKDAKELRFKALNRAGEVLLGYDKKQLLGKNDYDFFPKKQADFFTSQDRSVLESGVPLNIAEEPINTKDGVKWLHTQKIPISFINGKPQYLLGISVDITDMKIATDKIKKFNEELESSVKERTSELEQANTELKKQIQERSKAEESAKLSEERYRFLADSIPQIVWTANAKGSIDYINKHGFDYAGMNYEHSMGWGWLAILHPHDYIKTLNRWRHSLMSGEPYELEYRLLRKDGEYRWHLSRALPMKDANGKIVKWFGTATEIHDQKLTLEYLAKVKEDIEKMNEQLSLNNAELNKINQDLDNFVYTASHDLKAPVANIDGLLEMLDVSLHEKLIRDDEIENIVHLIKGSIERFQRTIKELTDIGKIQKNIHEDIEIIDIGSVLEELKLDIQNQIKESGAIINSDLSEISEIKFSKVNFRSVFYNVLINAIKYRSPERTPLIEIRTESKAGYIVLEIKDNGLGIKEGQQEKIFSMFKRLQSHIEGSGIGLYIVKRIMENANGQIKVDSVEGEGSIFRIYFPKTP